MPKQGLSGFARVRAALGYSLQGLDAAVRGESAFRQELAFALVMLPLAFWLDVGAVARALMVASVMLVLVAELLNSAIEAAIDRVSTERHALSKRAKDMGSAAVLLCLANVVLVWAAILVERYAR